MRYGNERGPERAVLYTGAVTPKRHESRYSPPRLIEAIGAATEREPQETDGSGAQEFDGPWEGRGQ